MVSAPTIWRQDLFTQMSDSAASEAQAVAPASFNSGGRRREQLGRRAPARLILEIEIAERLPGGVLHDEARIVMLPRSFKAAGSGVGLAVAGDLKNVPARP